MDINKLAKDIEEARALLARRDTIEREITVATSRLERLEARLAEAEGQLASVEQKIAERSNHFEHERNRYAIELADVQAQCLDSKRHAETEAAAARVKIDGELIRAREHHTSERRRLDKDIGDAKHQLDLLKAETVDFKRRIAAL